MTAIQSINGTLDTMKNNSSNLGDSLQDVSRDLSSLQRLP